MVTTVKIRPSLMAVFVVAMLVATQAAAAQAIQRSFRAMGTRILIDVRGPETAALETGVERVRALFERRHQAWYPWRPDSALARINRQLAAGHAAEAAPDLIALLRRARKLERLSGGRFNAAIGGLVELWGFDQPPPYDSAPPSPQAVLTWAALAPSLTNLDLNDGRVQSANPAVQLDLGGIAKGATVDAALEILREAGATGVLINAGGDLRVHGDNKGNPWRVGIRDPSGGILAGLDARDGQAVFSSGDYERFRETADGERQGHVLDPRTGQPAAGAAHATVVAPDGTLADAAATALLVAGVNNWAETARAMGVDDVLIADGAGTIYVSQSLHERLDRRSHSDRDIIVRAIPSD